MIEIENFIEASFNEGGIWIGDPVELFSRTDWREIQQQCKLRSSYVGYFGSKGAVDFCIIDVVDRDTTIYRVFRETIELGDVETSSGFLVLIAEDDVTTVSRKQIDTLLSGMFIDLDEPTEIIVTAKRIKIGEIFHVER